MRLIVNRMKNVALCRMLRKGISKLILKKSLIFTACILAFFANPYVYAQTANHVSLSGVTVYNPQDLLVAVSNHSSVQTSSLTIDQLAEGIQKYYRENGYFLAHVSTSSLNGKSHIEVREGKISKIEVSGASPELSKVIYNYITTAVGNGPVTLKNFERGLMLAKDLSGVNLTSEFVSSEATHDDVLKIAVAPVKQRGSFSLDNLPRNFGSGIYAFLSQEVYSIFTPGDLFRVNIMPSTDFNNEWNGVFGSLTYRAPVGYEGWYVEGTVGKGLTRNLYTGSGLSPQNLFQNNLNANIVVGYPLHRDAHSFLYTMSELGYTVLDNSLDRLNNTETAVFRQFLVYSENHSDGSTLRAGITLTGGVADKQYYLNQVVSDPSFYHLRFGVGYTMPLSDLSAGLGMRLEATAQFTTSSVPTTEKYFLGDRTRLRGYGYSELIGDSGIAATAEITQFYSVGIRYFDSISPFAFVDVGWIKQNIPIPGMLNQTPLASVGVGVQTMSKENFSIRSWIGLPLIAGNTTPAFSPAFWLQLTQAW